MRRSRIVMGLLLIFVCAGCMGSDAPATARYELEVRDGDAEQAARVLSDRLDGVKGASAEHESASRIVVELPQKNARALLPIVTARGRLELYDLQGHLVGPSISPQGFPVAISQREQLYANGLPEDVVILRCGVEQPYCPGVNEEAPTRHYYYAVRGGPELTGADFDRDKTRQEFDSNTNEPIVVMEFTEAGGRKFHEVTRELALRGRLAASRQNLPAEVAFRQFAIVIDGVLVSAPVIDFNENPDGIPPGNGAQISGIGSLEEVRQLAAVLRGGELPGRVVVARGSDVEMEN